MKKLEADRTNLQLDDEFIAQVKEQLKRFEIEIPYRKNLED